MTDLEIIARQAEEIINLKDKLAESEEASNYWYGEAQKRIPAEPLTAEETVHALANAEIPRKAEDF